MFELKIIRQHWVKDDGLIDSYDLCSHGVIYLKLGDTIIADERSGSWTLSAAALHLMRTLNAKYNIGDFASQLIPCCGHSLIAGELRVSVLGCPNGIDFDVFHKDDIIEISIDDKKEKSIELSYSTYKRIVLDFVNEVEHFYGEPSLKNVNEEDIDGFEQFWKEWSDLKCSLVN